MAIVLSTGLEIDEGDIISENKNVMINSPQVEGNYDEYGAYELYDDEYEDTEHADDRGGPLRRRHPYNKMNRGGYNKKRFPGDRINNNHMRFRKNRPCKTSIQSQKRKASLHRRPQPSYRCKC